MVTWDINGVYTGSNYKDSFEYLVNGYFNIAVKNKDNSDIDVNSLNANNLVKVFLQSKESKDISILNKTVNDLSNTGIVEHQWEPGSSDLLGNPLNDLQSNRTRMRVTPFKTPLVGKLKVTPLDSNQKVIVNLFNTDGATDKLGSWTAEAETYDVNGFYYIAVSWKDDSTILVEDVDVKVEYLDDVGELPILKSLAAELSDKLANISESFELFLTKGEYKPSDWVVGSLTGTGNEWNTPTNRLRLKTNLMVC